MCARTKRRVFQLRCNSERWSSGVRQMRPSSGVAGRVAIVKSVMSTGVEDRRVVVRDMPNA